MKREIDSMITGFRSFRETYFGGDSRLFKVLRHGQNPGIAVIACSDSRVDPALLTKSNPGDLFVIRNVANLVPPYQESDGLHGVSAALEFAVQVLNVEHLILLGHSDCGGIKALLGRDREHCCKSFLNAWLNLAEGAREVVEKRFPHAPEKVKLRACEEASLVLGLENLLTFPWICEKVDAGKLTLYAWYFDVGEGRLFHYDAASKTFRPLDEAAADSDKQ